MAAVQMPDIQDVMEKLHHVRFNPRKAGKAYELVLCPFHDNHNTPALSVMRGRNAFRCHSCGARGGVYKAIAAGLFPMAVDLGSSTPLRDQLTPAQMDAVRRYARCGGYACTEVEREDTPRPDDFAVKPEWNVAREARRLEDRQRAMSQVVGGKTLFRWLKDEHGIGERTARHFGIGYTGQDWPKYSFAMPYFSPQGTYTGANCRFVRRECSPDDKYRKLTGGTAKLFNVRAIRPACEASDPTRFRSRLLR